MIPDIDEQVSLDSSELVVDGNRYDLDDYDDVVVVDGGNAAAMATLQVANVRVTAATLELAVRNEI